MIEVKAGIDYFGLELDEYPDSCFSSPAIPAKAGIRNQNSKMTRKQAAIYILASK